MPSAKYLLPISALTLTFMTSAGAADSRFIASLSKLDPQTRLEQVCDLAAVNQIGRTEKMPKPRTAFPRMSMMVPPWLPPRYLWQRPRMLSCGNQSAVD